MSFGLFTAYILCSYLRPVELFAPDLAPYRPMLWLWLIAFVAALGRVMTRREFAARRVHLGLLGLFIAVIAISQVVNQWAGGALPAVLDFSTSALLMVLCFMNLTSAARVRTTCAVIAATVVVLTLISIYSFHTGYQAQELVLRQNTDGENLDETGDVSEIPALDTSNKHILRIRSAGFLSDPNDFAQAMVMVVPLLLIGFGQRSLLGKLLFVGVPTAILGYGVYLTQSRGALLGVAALVLFPLHRWLGTTRTLLLVGCLGLAVVGASFGGREISSKETSASQRIEAWSTGLNLLRSKPLFGVGYGNFLDHHELTAHNSFVLCFAELGLIGYFAWLGLLVLAFKGLQEVIARGPPERPERRLALALRAAFVAFMVCAWFLSRTYQPGLYVLLALCIAVWHCDRQHEGSAGPVPAVAAASAAAMPWRQSTVLLMVATIAVVYAFVLSHNLSR